MNSFEEKNMTNLILAFLTRLAACRDNFSDNWRIWMLLFVNFIDQKNEYEWQFDETELRIWTQ